MKNYGQRFVTLYRGRVTNTIPTKRNARRPRRKGKIQQAECRVPENSKEIKEGLLK